MPRYKEMEQFKIIRTGQVRPDGSGSLIDQINSLAA
jgi:hypothetical protein